MTERAAARRPWIELGARELRALLVSLLAGVYLAVWPSLAAPPAPATPAPAATIGRTDTVWLDRLPPSERPAVDVPAGWTLASSTLPARELTRPSTPAARPRIARISRTHSRIRTRSS